MNQVLDFLEKTREFQVFKEALEKKGASVLWKEASEELAVTAIQEAWRTTNASFVVVTPNLYKAQLLYDRLSSSLSEDCLGFFPQDEFITVKCSSAPMSLKWSGSIPSATFWKERDKSLSPYRGVTKSPDATGTMEEAVLELISGHDYEMDRLAKTLVEYGFKREYTVEKPGDFSVRGGILDLFPLNASEPYRLDFFGDTLETIKAFDIETQRSVRLVDGIRVFPMYEFFYDDKELQFLIEIIDVKVKNGDFSPAALTKIQKDRDSLLEHEELDRLGRYIPFLTGKETTILDLFEEKNLFFVDFTRILDQYELMKREIADWYLSMNDYAAWDSRCCKICTDFQRIIGFV